MNARLAILGAVGILALPVSALAQQSVTPSPSVAADTPHPSSPTSQTQVAPADAGKRGAAARSKKKTSRSPGDVAAKPRASGAPPGKPPDQAAAMQTELESQRQALQKERAELQQMRGTTVKLVRALVSRGLLSLDEAKGMVPESELEGIASASPVPAPVEMATAGTPRAAPAPQGAPAASATSTAVEGNGEAQEERELEDGVVRVPYVPEVVKNQIRDQVREEVIAQAKAERWAQPNSLPEWLDRISLEGDLLLRYEGDRFGAGNTPVLTYNAINGTDLTNTTQDTDRLRYRARIDLLARITEAWSAGFRLASGDTNNPVATLQTLGTYAERGPVTIDRAYARWDPNERFTLSGGRMPNPYFHTDLVWDIDLGFEGAYASYRPRLSDRLEGFVTAGAYILQYQSPTPTTPSPKNKYLVGLQAGIDWATGDRSKLRAAISYYDYKNVSGIPNPTLYSQIYDWTAPLFRQKGNTVFNIDNDANPMTNKFALASKFQIVNLTAKLDLKHFDPFEIRLIGDFAKNIGFDQAEIRARTGLTIDSDTTAWRAGLAFGKLEINGWKDWQVFADYRHLGADSVLDAFTDSEFYLGGTNVKGYTVGGLLGLDRNVWLRLRWMSGDEIQGPPLAIDVLQFDLNVRF
jgi:hypothetical protein